MRFSTKVEEVFRALIRAATSSQQGRRGLIFIGGCPRSGTTALQVFLSGHPAIATVRETHLFDFYLGPFLERYRNEAQVTMSNDGIRNLVSDSDMARWCKSIADTVFERVLKLKPGAAIVLEKTPGNAMFAGTIADLYPDASFISVIRDPRAVAASLMAASAHSWGAWAPSTAADAAQRWLDAIAALPAIDRSFGRRHIRVRYEDFIDARSDARTTLIAFLASQCPDQAFRPSQFALPAAGLTADLGLSDDRYNPTKDDRADFFRRGTPDGWRTELTRADIETIEVLCRDDMEKLGYVHT